jgi:hypothetical protein
MRWFGTSPNILNMKEQTLYNYMFVFRFFICPAERERSILLVKICIYFIKLLFYSIRILNLQFILRELGSYVIRMKSKM